jgi:hypothetical protein
MKDTHLLITVLVIGKILLISLITFAVKARKVLHEIRTGLELVGALRPKTPESKIETKVLKPDSIQETGVTQPVPQDPNTDWDKALLEEIENISRLSCCSAHHPAGEPHDPYNGTPVVVSTQDFRKMILWGLSKAREQGRRDGASELIKKQDAPPAGEMPR